METEIKMIESIGGERFPAKPMEAEIKIPGPIGYEGEPEVTIPVKVETYEGSGSLCCQIITLPVEQIGYSGQLEELLRQLTEKKMFNKELPTLIEQTDEKMPHSAFVVYFWKNIASRWIAIRGVSRETEILFNPRHKNWSIVKKTWPGKGLRIGIPPQVEKKKILT